MKKHIKVTTITPEDNIKYEVDALYDARRHIISYVEKDELNTIVRFSYDELELSRSNKDYEIKYKFEERNSTKGTIKVRTLPNEVITNIMTKKIEQKDLDITIEFTTEDHWVTYQIEVK